MANIHLVFPHQLVKENPLFEIDGTFYLVEEWLFFKQYNFHKQKIAFHRATMQHYEQFVEKQGKEVVYISSTGHNCDIRTFIAGLPNSVEAIHCLDPVDDWLKARLQSACKKQSIELTILESPVFINETDDLTHFFKSEKKQFHQTTFYKQERKKLDVLMDGDNPQGGNWTFDTENRKKYPKNKTPPPVHFPSSSKRWEEAVSYVKEHFADHYGEASEQPLYPVTFQEAENWLEQFFDYRFHEFGAYEDAIVENESVLHHSVLSPLLNTGLLTPDTVIEKAVDFAEKNDVPINSLEGFVRQIIGWREFIRGMYITKGGEQRTKNFWQFNHVLPGSFYDGSTGIPPVDNTIKKVLKTGYCHHIERLMILANFMTLCEINPEETYQWFMELFIDAYDWVMVPNVYGMATFSDGGMMSTKPYISSSNYIQKMSNYSSGKWEAVWDGLFWRFMQKHRKTLSENARLNMLLSTLDRMSDETLNNHLEQANQFLQKLHTQ